MRICMVSSGLVARNTRLQPWRYLLGIAAMLRDLGHEVHLVSNGPEEGRTDLDGLLVHRVRRFRGDALARTVNGLAPQRVLWHLGLTSFLNLRAPEQVAAPVVGIFTSPIYRARELWLAGPFRLLRGYRLSALHLLGLLIPRRLVRRAFSTRLLGCVVVECTTTHRRLIERGAPAERVHVARPAIDEAWFEDAVGSAERAVERDLLGFSSDDFVVGYFGPPTPLRGLPVLLRAVAEARVSDRRVKALILSRRRGAELRAAHRAIERLRRHLHAGPWSQMITGFLSRERLVRLVASCDAIAFPFGVVPSDVPVSVLEAMSLGLPVVTGRVACLPELVAQGGGLCVPSRDATALADGLLRLAADEEFKRRLGEGAKRRAVKWQSQAEDGGVWRRVLA